jgi:hypothetical protein
MGGWFVERIAMHVVFLSPTKLSFTTGQNCERTQNGSHFSVLLQPPPFVPFPGRPS